MPTMATTFLIDTLQGNLAILLVLWLVSIILLYYSLSKKSTNPTTQLRLPPSPPAIPFVGHIHHISLELHKSLQNLVSKHGPLIRLRFGNLECLLVSSTALATEIYRMQDLIFCDKPKNGGDDGIVFGKSGIAGAPYGDFWRFARKLCVTELLSTKQISRSCNVRRDELTQLLHRIIDKACKSEIIDLSSEIKRATNNGICRMVMSTRCSGEDNEAEKCRELVDGSLKVAPTLLIAKAFDGRLKILGSWLYAKRLRDLNRKFDELLEKILQEHEKKSRGGNGESETEDQNDLMDILLKLYRDDDSSEFKITRKDIKGVIADLFIAGTGTTSDAIICAMAELIDHPAILKKLREEIESVVGKGQIIEESDIPKIPYLHAIVKETLRLHPPASIIPRLCSENCKLGGFDVPKDTNVLINIHTIMRDPKVWENPDEFCPERFLVSNNNNNNKAQEIEANMDLMNSSFLPFGGGRRVCPGKTLAFGTISTVVGAMVQCFDWKLEGSDQDKAINIKAPSEFFLNFSPALQCLPIVYFNPFAV